MHTVQLTTIGFRSIAKTMQLKFSWLFFRSALSFWNVMAHLLNFDPAINFRLISFHQNLLAHGTVLTASAVRVNVHVNLQPKQIADAQKTTTTFNATEPSTWPLCALFSLITGRHTRNSIANRFVHHTEHLVKHLYFLLFPLDVSVRVCLCACLCQVYLL